MDVLLALLLVALVCGAVAVAVVVSVQETRRRHAAEFFLNDSDQAGGRDDGGVAGLKLPTAPIHLFNKTKRQMYQQYADPTTPFDVLRSDRINGESSDDDDDASGSDFEGEEDLVPWQRSLPVDARNSLKSLLVKRTMSTMPVVEQLTSQFPAKARLSQMHLMSQGHWKKIEDCRTDFDEEVEVIKYEAEALQEDWGKSGRIFREASMFYHHDLQKREKAKDQQQRAREEKEDKDRQQRLAQKMLRGLLRQEDNEKGSSAARLRATVKVA